ncbi:hypothetical protein WDU94_006094 [Cyamophila willieti]
MEKKRKLVEAEEVPDSEKSTIKKKEKDIQNENDIRKNLSPDTDSQENGMKKDKKKKKKKRKLEEENGINEDSPTNEITNNASEHVESENDTKKEKRRKLNKTAQNDDQSNNTAENEESKTPFIEGDGVTTPTTKKPPRKSGETKKQYKRRMKALREAGLLIDPPVVEGIKKDKRNRKTRKEKRDTKAKKNEELDRFRSIIQINYLKMWKNDQSKWKFNKNVQGKLFKHMFDTSRIPQDMFEILIEYIASSKSPNVHTELNKKCSEVVESMEKWSSASEEEKKKLTEPSSDTYERARQVLQSLA